MGKKYTEKYIIETGIGLQDVDGIKNSAYFLDQSNRYIKGEITLDELDEIITSYYIDKPDDGDRGEEADKVAARIAKIISEDAFTFSVGQLMSIHGTLFEGLLKHPGQPRGYNFTKKEWVLDGASVTYGDFRELESTLQYDFEQEKRFRYGRVSIDEAIEHLAYFLSNLWQIHVFEEGNTRATAVFFIKYLRTLGFDVTNDTFAKNAWYFRNALVRANYTNVRKEIYEDRSFLIKFLRNLLLNEKNQLRNRDLRLSASPAVQDTSKHGRFLQAIKANPHITSEDLSKEIGVSVRTVKNALKSLTESGKIKRKNGKRFGYWEVKEG